MREFYRKSDKRHIALLLMTSALFLCIAVTRGECGNSTTQTTMQPIIVVTGNWPPYAIEQSTTTRHGMDVDVAIAAFKRTGINVEFRFYTWSRCFEEIEEGHAAAILGIINVPSRTKHFLTSRPLSVSSGIFLVRKDYSGPVLSTFADLAGLNIAVVDGYAIMDDLTKLNIAYDLSHNEEIAMRKVADKRLDVALLELRNARHTIFKLGFMDKFKWYVTADKYVFRIGINRKWPNAAELLEAFNNGLDAIIKDGTYDAIHARYE